MSSPNHYETLSVSQTASEAEIKKAYRTLSLKYHPDRNSSDDAATKIREINDAYEILGDAQKRQQYDAQLQGGGGFPFGMQGGMNDMNDMGNIFKMMFGQGGMPGMHGMHGMPEIRVFHGGHPFGPGGHPFGPGGMHGQMFHQMQKPPPIVKNIQLSMEQAFQGCTLPIEIERWTHIGDTKINETETIYITFPPGIDENEMLIMPNRGNVINDTNKGDIKITIQLLNTTQFTRQGVDLIYKKTISLKESLCGFSFEITHLNGKVLCLNNKASATIVKPNYKKVINGLGMIRDGNPGNLIIEFTIEFPESLTSEQITSLAAIL